MIRQHNIASRLAATWPHYSIRILIGAKVRIYYEADADGFECVYDEGLVTAIDNGFVVVDFLDWIEQWQKDKFSMDPMSHYQVSSTDLIPIGPGTIVMDFRIKPDVVVPLWADRQPHHTV